MAHSDSHRDSDNDAEPNQDDESEQSPPKVILPPISAIAEEAEERTPYANEMLLLAFEGRHKKFEVSYKAVEETHSYEPPPSPIQVSWFRRLLDKLFKPIP